MKQKFFVAHIAITAALGCSVAASAQDWSRAGGSWGGVPKQASPAESAQRLHDSRVALANGQPYRVVEGTNYNVVESQLWQPTGGKIYERRGGITILETPYIRYVKDSSYIAVTNFSGAALANESVDFLAIRIGTFDMDRQPIALFDMGTPYVPSPEQIAAARAAQEKARVDAKAKAAAQKAAGEARALQANQDAAAKGDAYGLMRMGERYRDGDGVEKDLSKAKTYLQKGADAGSPTAAEELSKLQQ